MVYIYIYRPMSSAFQFQSTFRQVFTCITSANLEFTKIRELGELELLNILLLILNAFFFRGKLYQL